MHKYICFCFLLVFFKLPWALAPDNRDAWVIWNTGQGLWVTHVLPFSCTHYDFGGEIGSFKYIRGKLLANCAYKENRLNLSHWHADHYINLNYLVKSLPRVCWESQPLFRPDNLSIKKIINLNIPSCLASEQKVQSWAPLQFKSVNESSNIYLANQILLPGDSPLAQEKKWSKSFTGLTKVKLLVLGHHGSRTSSGLQLLRKLPNLSVAVSSARRARYGHPHRQTLVRLQKSRVPVLRTEEWGNIWFSF
ncbi:MAG: hydrolase [Bdellovibrio sp.]|nr:hydrolase [Bdellovibrio sp.]